MNKALNDSEMRQKLMKRLFLAVESKNYTGTYIS